MSLYGWFSTRSKSEGGLTRDHLGAKLRRESISVAACGSDTNEDNNSASLVLDPDLISRPLDSTRKVGDFRPCGGKVR
jgi:hypothetical protein